MGNGEGSSGNLSKPLIALAVVVVLGVVIYVATRPEDGSRGFWHDSPSPPGSQERTVQMNLDEIRGLNGASMPEANPNKEHIEERLNQLTDPAFQPQDPADASTRVDRAWQAAKQTEGKSPEDQVPLWSTVREELDGIN